MHSLSDDVPKALHNVVLISLWCLFSDAIKHFSNAKASFLYPVWKIADLVIFQGVGCIMNINVE